MMINKDLLIERLTQRIDLDRLFMFHYSFLGKEYAHLILVMHEISGVSPKVMKPTVELCLMDIPELSFDIIPFGIWQHRLKSGSLYYAYASLPRHRLYATDRKKSKRLSVNEINGIVELSKSLFAKLGSSADECMEGAQQFAKQGNYLKATFMMHQSLECHLRLLQTMVQGKANNVHSLENRIRELCNHFPVLKDIVRLHFLDIEKFRVLDQSFHCVKQNKDSEIREEDFNFLLEKSSAMQDATRALYTEFLIVLEEEKKQRLANIQPQEPSSKEGKSAPAQPHKDSIHEDFQDFPWLKRYRDDANTLLDKIKRTHNPEQVIMLNYHTGGYSGSSLFQADNNEKGNPEVELYLVVLMKTTGPFHFKCTQVGSVNAMVLYLDLKYVARKLAEGNRFVHTLWTKGHILRRKSSFVPDFEIGEVDWEKEYEKVHKLCDCTSDTMKNIVANLEINSDVGGELMISGVKNLVEIGVISYLRCAVGFIPKGMPLAQLIDWTGTVNRKVVEYLYPKNQVELELLSLLLSENRVWWENNKAQLDKTMYVAYRAKATEFLDFFSNQLIQIQQQLKAQIEPVSV